LPINSSESDIQTQFIGLVSSISLLLRAVLSGFSEKKLIVGGILARYEYDIRSQCDPFFTNAQKIPLLASEVKTHRTFGEGDMWYHSSRGIQVLSALYTFNCPTFLLTQKQWKLFVENDERDAVFTFPYNDEASFTPHVNSSLVHPIGKIFLKAIVICILSERPSLVQPLKEISLAVPTRIDTPKKGEIIRESNFTTDKKPQKQSEQIQSSSGTGMRQPSFVSGYIDGQPIYSTIRVLPEEDVSRIEDEIALQEKMEFRAAQSSELTLFE
jgi:hypothetical protein